MVRGRFSREGLDVTEFDYVQWLASESGLRVYIAIFILLLVGGFGFPVPEDIPVILAGVAASKDIISIEGAFAVSYIGVVVADQIVYFMGYFFGQKLVTAGKRSERFSFITEEKVEEIREGLRKRRLVYIFIGRHVFPVRTVTFLTAGALRIPYLEFLAADAFAALVSVGMVLWLGYFLGGRLTPEVIHDMIHEWHIYVGWTALACFSLWLLRREWLRRKRSKESPI